MPRLFKGNVEVRLTGERIEIERGSIPFLLGRNCISDFFCSIEALT